MSFKQRRKFLWVLFLVGIVLIAIVANATTLVHLRFQQLVSYSSAIARVQCVGSDTRMENGEIWTDTRFRVIEREKGYLPTMIVVGQPGGKLQNVHTHVEGSPEFRPGQEVFLFLFGKPGKQFNVVAGRRERSEFTATLAPGLNPSHRIPRRCPCTIPRCKPSKKQESKMYAPEHL